MIGASTEDTSEAQVERPVWRKILTDKFWSLTGARIDEISPEG
jgi:hypothetical protein